MSKITIDLVKLIEQALPQVIESIDIQPLQQWLDNLNGAVKPVTVDLADVTIENEVEIITPPLQTLQPRINDVTTFGDDSELHIYVMAPRGSDEDLATNAYYGLLVATSNI